MLSRRISTNLIANIHETFLKCQPKMQQQICLIHHHKELEQPGGHLRFIGVQRSNRHKANRNTHVNERKFAKLRGRKTFLIRLDDHEERREMDKLPPDQLRLYMLRKGKPNMFANIEPRKWEEHQITYQSCWTIIEPYVPPEKSLITRIGKDKTAVLGDIKDLLRTKWTSIGHGEKRIRKKQGLENFSSAEFPKEAEQIMISTYQALANRDKRKLLGLVTEMMFTKLWPQVEEGTLRWEFVRFTEPSRVIGVRVVDMPLKSGNDIAQVTVRFKYMQKGAYYDRFGHLFLGSEDEEKEVIEYVVFENHIASESGKWRFHARVYPDSSKPKQAIDRPSLIEEDKANRKAPLEPQKLRPGVDQYLKTRKEAEENVPLICLPKSTYFCTKFSPLPKSTYFCTKFSPLPKSTCFCTKLGGNLNFHIYFLFSLLKSNMH